MPSPYRASPAKRHWWSSLHVEIDLRVVAAITPPSLPIAITRPDGHSAAAAPRTEIPTEGLSLEDNERMLLARALEKTGGNQTQAARLLRITRDTLRYKMKKFNLR